MVKIFAYFIIGLQIILWTTLVIAFGWGIRGYGFCTSTSSCLWLILQFFCFVSDSLPLQPHSQIPHFKQLWSGSCMPPKSTCTKEFENCQVLQKHGLRYLLLILGRLKSLLKRGGCWFHHRIFGRFHPVLVHQGLFLTKLSNNKSMQKEKINKDELNCKCMCFRP